MKAGIIIFWMVFISLNCAVLWVALFDQPLLKSSLIFLMQLIHAAGGGAGSL